MEGIPMADSSPYPLRLEGDLAPQLNRWLWLVKWALLIPHFILLFFLWVAFFALSVVALFAILFTGRYPRGIFEFNVGVLRWTWRGGVFSYSAPGTAPVPPFTPREAPGGPARPCGAPPPSPSPGPGL